MNRRARQRIPVTLFARLVALLAVTLLATQLVGGVLFFVTRPPPPGASFVHLSEVAEALRAERAAPVAARRDFRRGSELRRLSHLEPLLARKLGVPREDVLLWQGGAVLRSVDRTQVDPVIVGGYSAALRVGETWVGVQDRVLDPHDMLSRMGIWLVVSLACVAPVAVLLGARLTSPITAFAEAADRLGRNPYADPMRETGPAEVVLAIKAFNDMQSRLRAYIDDRVRMVGAIAHDLRTPLTRLRLQVQALSPAARMRAEAEIERLDQMVEGALAFVKDAASPQERVPLHLLSLVEAVAEDLSTAETYVEVEEGVDPVVLGDEGALRRVVSNLVGNAIRYPGEVRCRVLVEGDGAILQIDDQGPGLAEGDLERAFEPYVRLTEDGSGIGLGLSIVRSVARAHGGEAILINRETGGLRAQVRLPLAATSRARRPDGETI